MREICTCSLGGGRRLARKRASSDPTPMNHSNKDRTWSAESEEGRLRIKENTFPPDTYPTQSGTARVPRVGECADKLTLDCLLVDDYKPWRRFILSSLQKWPELQVVGEAS